MRKILFSVLVFMAISCSRQEAPLLEQKDLFVGGTEGSKFYRIPALLATQKGTLIAVCDARIERWNDAPNNIDLAMKRSFDSGKTWTPLKIIVDYPGQEAAGDPCLLEDRMTGTIWLFFDYIVPREGFRVEMLDSFRVADDYDRNRIIFFRAMKSNDDGKTWSEAVNLDYLRKPEWDYIVAAPGNGIQAKDGTLIAPAYCGLPDGSSNSSLAIISEDHGETWKTGQSIGDYLVEPQVVELRDGSLRMSIRQTAQKGHRMYAVSEDKGLTWGEILPDTALPEPGSGCQASFIRYSQKKLLSGKNRILFSNPASIKGRKNLTIRISYDEGKTWKYSRTLRDGPSAYSSMTVLPDGTIGILYEQGEQSILEKISFARFNMEWLTDGKDKTSRN